MPKSAHGISIPETLAEAVRPDTTALIVYDMQVGILRQLKSGPRCARANVLKVLEAARAAGVRIFFMRHMSLPKKLAGVFQLRQTMVWQQDLARRRASLVPARHARLSASRPSSPCATTRRSSTRSRCRRSKARRSRSRCATAAEELRHLRHRDRDRHRADRAPRRRPRLHPDRGRGRLRRRRARGGERALAGMRFIGDAMICSVDELAAAWR